VHVQSYTADPADLTAYGPLEDGRGRLFRLRWQAEGSPRVAELDRGQAALWVADRDAAQALTNMRLLHRPRPAAADRRGRVLPRRSRRPRRLRARRVAPLGRIDAVHDYGAGASLEIGRLIVPFTRAVVPDVDIAAGRVTVLPPEEIEARP
jgi:16S rRNA processing protein RimM